MKKIITIIMISTLILILEACKRNDSQNTSALITPLPTQVAVTAVPTQEPADPNGTGSDVNSSTGETTTDKSSDHTQNVYKDISYDISEVSYLSGGTMEIYYPQIVHMEDKNVQDKVNETIRLAAMKYASSFDASQENNRFENDYIITWKGNRLLSIKFLGYRNEATSAHPSSFANTININLETGDTVKLSDMIKTEDKLLKMIQDKGFSKYLYFNEKRELIEDSEFQNPENLDAIKDYIFNDSYPDKLANIDDENGMTFSYFTGDSLGISFGTPHAAGDHIQFEVKYQDIQEYLKLENPLWNDFTEMLQKVDAGNTNGTGSSNDGNFAIDENLFWKNINYLPGFSIMKDQSFQVNLESWGDVYFIAGSGEGEYSLNNLYLFLADKNSNVLYEFPSFYGNSMTLSRVAAISFRDVNSDGQKDVIVIAYYMTGVGPTGAKEFPIADVYFQTDGQFVALPEVGDEINTSENNDSIDAVVNFVKDLDITIN